MAKDKKEQIEIMTLSGSALLDYYRLQSDSDSKPLEIDLSKPHSYMYNDIVSGRQKRNDNAFYYQARIVIRKKFKGSVSVEEKNNEALNEVVTDRDVEDKRALICHMVYVDFNNVFTFSGKNKKNNSEDEDQDGTAQSENDDGDERKKNDRKFTELLFSNGINVCFTFEDCILRTPTHLVPYDKSNSMARNSTILFIDKDIKEELDRRLTIGIDFSKFQVVLSKYYAYRGLYLSDSSRIRTSDDFLLNKESVIVISDDNKPFPKFKNTLMGKPKTIVTGKEEPEGSKLWHIYEGKIKEGKVEGKEGKKDDLRMNVFDGEGLICPEYAEYIRKALKIDARSFQVRMPFTKGMLHELDWTAIINEAMSIWNEDCFGIKRVLKPAVQTTKAIWIKDCFGIERDLTKAKIILTKSMLKCAGWYISWKDTMGSAQNCFDPMEHFFEYFHKYDHALYIANTDARLYNEGYTTLNYQFLNPLGLAYEQIIDLVDKHCKYIEDDKHLFPQYEKMDGEELIDPKLESWQNAFRQFPDLLRSDKKINGKLRGRDESLRRMITRGNLYVQGECRFLARDLLALVLFILRSCRKGTWDEQKLEALQNQTLMSNHFYAAQVKDSIAYDFSKYYAVLRSPHLARNEETVMQPQAKHYYTKYMSHLTGVCMVNYNSLVPMALSGADFDGDLIKIIDKEDEENEKQIVVQAIQKNAYLREESEKKITRKGPEGKTKISYPVYQRVLPEIDIPGTYADKKYLKDVKGNVDFQTIEDTFSSRVGQISNMAVRIGMQYYKPDKTDGPVNQQSSSKTQPSGKQGQKTEYEDRCAHCTILVGLEIDACKNGAHPDLSKIEKYYQKLVKNEASGQKKDYINKIKSIEDLPLFQGYKVDGKTEADKYIVKKTNSREKIEIAKEPDTTLDLLLTQFVEQHEAAQANPLIRYGEHFRRLLEKKYGKERYHIEDKARTAEICAIMEAYRDVLEKAKNDRKLASRLKNAKLHNRAITLLLLQYDDLYKEEAAFSGNFIIDVFCQAVDNLNKIFEEKSAEECEKYLEGIICSNWIFTPMEKREDELKRLLGLEMEVSELKGTKEANHDKGKELDPDVIKLLTNFDQSGYMILYYLVKQIARDKELNAFMGDPEQEDVADYEPKDETESETSDPDDQDAPQTMAYKNAYLNIYLNARRRKVEQETWEEELNQRCREDLERVIEDKSKLIDHVLAIKDKADPNEDFFWSVFSAEEIIAYIQAAEDAYKGVKKDAE